MKKTIVLVILALAMTLFATTLQAENVYWEASSDNSCDTFFYVGEHDAPVTIMCHRMSSDLTPMPDYYDWEVVVSLGVNDHYASTGQCPNFRYMYKLVYTFESSSNTQQLASTRVFQVSGMTYAPSGASSACHMCIEPYKAEPKK
ncbi:MAG: hypothetical protein GY757_27285 [bacterium]|nr:hypothetical protein [bacterium]